MRRGFTLIEMLVVIGIIAVLIGASIGGFSYVTKRAEQARGRELVSNVATALNVIFQRQSFWPKMLLNEAQGAGLLTAEASSCFVAHKLIDLTYQEETDNGESRYVLKGLDRCGIVSPWATAVLKRLPAGDSGFSARVPSGGTVRDHLLHFALDEDGDGITEAKLGAKTVRVRANAVVWSWGRNGREDDYEASQAGRGNADDIYSWTSSQEVR